MVAYTPAGRDNEFDVPDFPDTANLKTLFKLFADTAAGLVEGIIVCTTATRPASPVTGQHIFDTDVGSTLVWDGASWVVIAGGGGGSSWTNTFLLMGA